MVKKGWRAVGKKRKCRGGRGGGGRGMKGEEERVVMEWGGRGWRISNNVWLVRIIMIKEVQITFSLTPLRQPTFQTVRYIIQVIHSFIIENFFIMNNNKVIVIILKLIIFILV